MIVVAVFVLLLVQAVILVALRRSIRQARTPRDVRATSSPDPYVPYGECCAPGCGVEVAGDALHTVVEISTDDDDLGIEGQTGMAADYCREHCPGGCRHGCVASAA